MKYNKGSIGRKSENFFKMFENLFFKYVAENWHTVPHDGYKK